jgi:hypothetical protein
MYTDTIVSGSDARADTFMLPAKTLAGALSSLAVMIGSVRDEIARNSQARRRLGRRNFPQASFAIRRITNGVTGLPRDY